MVKEIKRPASSEGTASSFGNRKWPTGSGRRSLTLALSSLLGISAPMRLSLIALVLTGMATLLSRTIAQEAQRSDVENSQNPGTPASAGGPTAQRGIITFKGGRLTVKVQGRSLAWILDEISQKAGVAIVTIDNLENKPTSIQVEDRALDDGLRQILKNHDAYFFYGVEGEGPSLLKTVWVYPKGRGRGFEPVPLEKCASTKEFEGMMGDPNPDVRSRAVEALIDRKRGKALDLVLQTLNDGDDQVRTRALYAAQNSGLELPAETLSDLALYDASPEVRVLALDALLSNPKVRAIAERALKDPDPHVQSKAQEILEELALTDRLPESSQPVQGQRGPRDQ